MITFGPDGNIVEVSDKDSGYSSSSTWKTGGENGDSARALLHPKGRYESCLGCRISFRLISLRGISSLLVSTDGKHQTRPARENKYPKERKMWSCYSSFNVRSGQYETF